LKLTSVDWLILLLYVLFVLGMALSVRSRIKTSVDFLLTGRTMPLWICALAFAGASISAPEVIGLGALGARYGLQAAHFYGIAAIPAMVLLGLFLMPLYYGSGARSVPEFLGLRFDRKTRILTAGLFALMTVFSSSVSLYAIARVVQALHVFDSLFRSIGRPAGEIFPFAIVLSAIIVMACVIAGGLAGTMYTQVLHFCVFVAGLLPLTLLGLKSIGGWAGLRASIPAAMAHEWRNAFDSNANPMGMGPVGLFLGLGLALGAGCWFTNVAVLQPALAAAQADAARRVPLIAAIPRMLLPFLVVIPGLVAIALPTPHSVSTVTTNPDGSIVHNIQVVSPEAAEGKGIVPAKIDAATRQPVHAAGGQAQLNYDMVVPNMLLNYFPTGMLGLGLAGLLAAFMSGMAGNVTAVNTVFTRDVYQSAIRKSASEEHCLAVARWTTVASVALSIGGVFAIARFESVLEPLILIASIVNAPLLAAVLLGMFWKRSTGHGAFAGVIAGTVAAILHHALTLTIDSHPGVHGGWIRIVHQYPNEIVQNVWGAIIALCAGAFVMVVVSLTTSPRPERELAGMIYSLTPLPGQHRGEWWRRPEALAAAILIGAIAINIFLA
jgi:solute:Na+ symporter, SSS family